jgi:tetratricopeptide (TPR) repeat protein
MDESIDDYLASLELAGDVNVAGRARDDALCGLAEVYTKKGCFEAAAERLAAVADSCKRSETAAVTLRTVAESAKADGNVAYKQRIFPDAMASYTTALRANRALRTAQGETQESDAGATLALDDFDHIVYSNRAACYQQMGDHRMAIDDSREAVKLKPSYVKAWRRLVGSYSALSLGGAIVKAARQGLVHCPGDAVLVEALQGFTSNGENVQAGNKVTLPPSTSPLTSKGKRASVAQLAQLMRAASDM